MDSKKSTKTEPVFNADYAKKLEILDDGFINNHILNFSGGKVVDYNIPRNIYRLRGTNRYVQCYHDSKNRINVLSINTHNDNVVNNPPVSIDNVGGKKKSKKKPVKPKTVKEKTDKEEVYNVDYDDIDDYGGKPIVFAKAIF